MKARIASASHVWPHKSGKLRIRVDFFPEESDPLYEGCHVEVPERALTPEEEARVAKGKTEEEQHTILEQILAAIPKVWRVNPINCHMFLLPVGFTQKDLQDAISSRIPELKKTMADAKKQGFSELRGLPRELQSATQPPKGKGKALVSGKEWNWEAVAQASIKLNGLEVRK